jgi:hypothetical protein
MELLDKRSISALVFAGGFLIYNYLANTTLVISIIRKRQSEYTLTA